jgi:hypothetical protein
MTPYVTFIPWVNVYPSNRSDLLEHNCQAILWHNTRDHGVNRGSAETSNHICGRCCVASQCNVSLMALASSVMRYNISDHNTAALLSPDPLLAVAGVYETFEIHEVTG